jgi:uncharacterized cupredoxin-like copper-binding protein
MTRLTHLRGRVGGGAALAGVALLVAACGSSASSSQKSTSTTAAATSAGAPASAGGASVVKLSANPKGMLAFSTMKLTAKAGKVTIEMKDPASSGVAHGIAVEGHGVDQVGKIVQPGGTSTVTLTLKPGTYTFLCPVPGHEAAGMKGTLVVT